ncbi:hypothetical protein ILUMI_24902 [Ignelater luminosus]|uniref:Uncharacterized protein n=1 Tax=Ignelater luminosus TaxID=2038154 RepID=A0A8K0CBL3_IGNLU|nr:hypothetical protein ILUMI_24902 [Ignelater luminosus]
MIVGNIDGVETKKLTAREDRQSREMETLEKYRSGFYYDLIPGCSTQLSKFFLSSEDEVINPSIVCDKYGIFDKSAAIAVLKDVGIINTNDTSKIIDKKNNRRFVQELASRSIKARQFHHQTAEVRHFVIPKLNFGAAEYFNLITGMNIKSSTRLSSMAQRLSRISNKSLKFIAIEERNLETVRIRIERVTVTTNKPEKIKMTDIKMKMVKDDEDVVVLANHLRKTCEKVSEEAIPMQEKKQAFAKFHGEQESSQNQKNIGKLKKGFRKRIKETDREIKRVWMQVLKAYYRKIKAELQMKRKRIMPLYGNISLDDEENTDEQRQIRNEEAGQNSLDAQDVKSTLVFILEKILGKLLSVMKLSYDFKMIQPTQQAKVIFTRNHKVLQNCTNDGYGSASKHRIIVNNGKLRCYSRTKGLDYESTVTRKNNQADDHGRGTQKYIDARQLEASDLIDIQRNINRVLLNKDT